MVSHRLHGLFDFIVGVSMLNKVLNIRFAYRNNYVIPYSRYRVVPKSIIVLTCSEFPCLISAPVGRRMQSREKDAEAGGSESIDSLGRAGRPGRALPLSRPQCWGESRIRTSESLFCPLVSTYPRVLRFCWAHCGLTWSGSERIFTNLLRVTH